MDFGFPAMIALAFLQSEQDFMRRMLFVSLLHELGHGFVMCLTGAGIREIRLHASGIQMLTGSRLLSTGQAFWIYLSGPLVNLVSACLLWHTQPETAVLHLGMGLFNLLPYSILDGGALLQCILECKCDFLKVFPILSILLSVAAIFAGYYCKIQNPAYYLMAVYLAVSEFFVDKHLPL